MTPQPAPQLTPDQITNLTSQMLTLMDAAIKARWDQVPYRLVVKSDVEHFERPVIDLWTFQEAIAWATQHNQGVLQCLHLQLEMAKQGIVNHRVIVWGNPDDQIYVIGAKAHEGLLIKPGYTLEELKKLSDPEQVTRDRAKLEGFLKVFNQN